MFFRETPNSQDDGDTYLDSPPHPMDTPPIEGFNTQPTPTPLNVETVAPRVITQENPSSQVRGFSGPTTEELARILGTNNKTPTGGIAGPTPSELAGWAREAEAKAKAAPLTDKAKNWLHTGHNKWYAGGVVLVLVAVVVWLKLKK